MSLVCTYQSTIVYSRYQRWALLSVECISSGRHAKKKDRYRNIAKQERRQQNIKYHTSEEK